MEDKQFTSQKESNGFRIMNIRWINQPLKRHAVDGMHQTSCYFLHAVVPSILEQVAVDLYRKLSLKLENRLSQTLSETICKIF